MPARTSPGVLPLSVGEPACASASTRLANASGFELPQSQHLVMKYLKLLLCFGAHVLLGGRQPVFNKALAGLTGGQSQQQTARKPDRIGTEAPQRHRKQARRRTAGAAEIIVVAEIIQAHPQRGGQLVKKIVPEVFDGRFLRFRGSVGERHHIDRCER